MLEDAETLFRTSEEEYRAAKFAEEIARFELEMAQAALIRTRPMDTSQDEDDEVGRQVFEIRAPIDGRVLRLILESAKVVTAGTELLEVGDPADLEVEIDVLSKDAVRVKPGQTVLLEQWGGDEPLQGVVRLVEPAGFTKISALGVEEQRVNVIVDFTDPPETRASLGDSFRVEARIIVWQGQDVLKVPISAMFRHQDQWAVFAVDAQQTARWRAIRIGHRNGMEAEVLEGLESNEIVIMHPSDRVADGVKVVARKDQ
jgi:HlyD family secretion protein